MDLTQDFLEQMFTKLNPNIDDEELGFFIEDTEEVLWEFLVTNIAEKLSDKQMDEFTEMIENDCTDDEIYAFLKKHIEKVDAFLKGVYTEFEQIYIDEAAKFDAEEGELE